MIVVTGAAGFIGSCLVGHLNRAGYTDIVVVDDFSKTEKEHNLEGKTIISKVGRNGFNAWFRDFAQEVEFVFHIGARTDTTEFNKAIFDELNELSLKENELEELDQELKVLSSAEGIKAALTKVFRAYIGAGCESSHSHTVVEFAGEV